MKIFVFIISTILFSSAYAQGQCYSRGCISQIESLYTEANGVIYVSTLQDEKLANCKPVSGVYFTLDPSKRNAKYVYSTLLAAYIAQQSVHIRIRDNGEEPCEILYVTLDQRHPK